MKKNYLRRYVTHFKLIRTGDDIYSNTGGTSVLKIDNDLIFVRENTFKWNQSYNDLRLQRKKSVREN